MEISKTQINEELFNNMKTKDDFISLIEPYNIGGLTPIQKKIIEIEFDKWNVRERQYAYDYFNIFNKLYEIVKTSQSQINLKDAFNEMKNSLTKKYTDEQNMLGVFNSKLQFENFHIPCSPISFEENFKRYINRKGNRLEFHLDNISTDNNEINIGDLIHKKSNNLNFEIKYYDEKNELNTIIDESICYRMIRLHSKDLLNSINYLKINDITYNTDKFKELTERVFMKDLIDIGYFDINLKDVIISLKPNKKSIISFF